MNGGLSTSGVPRQGALPHAWWLVLLLVLDAVLFWYGLTEDAVTVGTTVKKEFLGITLRVVDERQTFSILAAVFRLKDDGNLGLFGVIFLFSVLFPILKLAANLMIWIAMMRQGVGIAASRFGRFARHLHWWGKWSMLEVFVAGLLCVLLKLGDVTRFKVEPGMYWFFTAVLVSLINALLTERHLRAL